MTIKVITIDYLTQEVLKTTWMRIVDLQDFVREQFDHFNQENRKIELKISKSA